MSVPLLLDGGVSAELHRRGVPVAPPAWTASGLLDPRGRAELARVHADYAVAGARVHTALTFRCHRRVLAAVPGRPSPRSLVQHAVDAARAGCGAATVAASAGPLADCYRPDLVPAEHELAAGHAALARELAATDADLTLVETMGAAREARAALAAALAAAPDRPVWVSLVCGTGSGRARLLGGDGLAATAVALERDGASAILVNCHAAGATSRLLGTLRDACRGPVGVRPNLEDRGKDDGSGAHRPVWEPARFADAVLEWAAAGAGVVGGCCGTAPAHVAAAAVALHPSAGPSRPLPVEDR